MMGKRGIWKKSSFLCGSKLWQNSIGNESKLTTLKCNEAFEHNMKTAFLFVAN